MPISHFTPSIADYQVIKIAAHDEDAASELRYSLQDLVDANEEAAFAVDNEGLVTVRTKLDYERKKTYVYGVTVIDDASNPFSASTTLTIQIEDDNDIAPVFEEEVIYEFEVEENRRKGTLVGKVAARDSDATEEFRKIFYALEGPNELFTIDQKSGEIRLLQRLDREKKDTHHLVVKAGNIGSEGFFMKELVASVNVTIAVLDVNDNPPVFLFPNSSSHTVHINLETGVLVGSKVTTCKAVDADFGANGEVTFSILKGNDDHGFGLDSNFGIVYIVKNLLEAAKDSYDSHNTSFKQHSVYNLVIRATDSGVPRLSSSEVLSIHFNHTPPHHAPSKEKSSKGFGSLFFHMPLFLMLLAGVVGFIVVVGCLVCAMYFFCKFSKKHKVSRVLHNNKLYLVEKYKVCTALSQLKKLRNF